MATPCLTGDNKSVEGTSVLRLLRHEPKSYKRRRKGGALIQEKSLNPEGQSKRFVAPYDTAMLT
jgi:hypothetical protein